jgi:prepilin-type processing-associated H-X9-DG protein
MNATSYVLNDLVFDSPRFNGPHRIPQPANTMLLFILSESRAPSTTRDHIHGAEWGSWTSVLNDIEPDRHRTGARAPDRLAGSANYLFADGHAENLAASRLKEIIDRGTNPAAVPLD